MPRKSPFLNMTDLYTRPGSAEEAIEALSDMPEAQALFAAEIAYSRGEIDKVIEHASEFLQSHSGFYAVNAGGMLLALAAMWKGDISLYRQAKIHISPRISTTLSIHLLGHPMQVLSTLLHPIKVWCIYSV